MSHRPYSFYALVLSLPIAILSTVLTIKIGTISSVREPETTRAKDYDLDYDLDYHSDYSLELLEPETTGTEEVQVGAMPPELLEPETTGTEEVQVGAMPPISITSALDERQFILEIEEALIKNYFSELSEGHFFHNVPTEMQVNKEIVVEAGIAEKNIEQAIENLGVSGEVDIISSVVRYDPMETDIILFTSDAFKSEIISGGYKTIFAGSEPVWSWHVIPVKAGEHLIIMTVVVQFESSITDNVYSREITVFQEPRKVKINYLYSFRAFFSGNWRDLLVSSFGSGSLVGIVGWLMRRRQKKLEEKNKNKPVGFGAGLGSKQNDENVENSGARRR